MKITQFILIAFDLELDLYEFVSLIVSYGKPVTYDFGDRVIILLLYSKEIKELKKQLGV